MKTQIRKFIQKNRKYIMAGDCYEINPELAIFIEYKGTLLISYTIL
jgi:anthranilate/para-aminobenzoate synthase component I